MTKSTPQPVVAGVDGSAESSAAVRLAAAAASLRGARLRLLHARGAASKALPRHDATTVLADARRTALAACPGIDVTTDSTEATASTVLLGAAESASLLVIGARGAGGVSPMLLGSVALDVVTRAPRPVILARGGRPSAEAPVVVGISGAPTGRDAIGFAFAEAEARRVPLHAVHAFHYPNTTDESRVSRRDHQRADKLLTNWVDEWRDRYPTVEPRLFSVHAIDPVAALVDFSSTAGLLVLGARQRGKLRARLLGSTGYTLMRTSQCPLAIIHKDAEPTAASHVAPRLAERGRE